MDSEDKTQPLPRAIVDIERRLATLEEIVKKRGYDTRPFFEEHDKRIALLENVVTGLKERIGAGRIGPLKFEYGLCWAVNDPTPFCVHCWESKAHEKRHLQPGGDPGSYWCTNCKNFYRDTRIKEEPSGVVQRFDPFQDEEF